MQQTIYVVALGKSKEFHCDFDTLAVHISPRNIANRTTGFV